MDSNTFFDALIIGGGPSGLSAAMALSRACRFVALFDSQEYRNESAPMAHNILCHDGEKPEVYRATATEQIMEKYETITFIDTCITRARHIIGEKRPYFELTNDKGRVWAGWKLILASGTEDLLPSIQGYKELWGRGIVHCLFCDGYEHRGGHIGFLGLECQRDFESLLLSFPVAKDGVTVFTNGKLIMPDDEDTRKMFKIATARGASFDDRRIQSISQSPDGVGICLHFADGSDRHLRMLLHTPPTTNRAEQLIHSLGLEINPGPGNHVVSKSATGETSLRGCFVAGDTSTTAKIISVAAATGSLAGMGAAKQLALEEGLQAYEGLSNERQAA